MIELYGTFLKFKVFEILKRQEKALSVKEIALLLKINESQREQTNFERRVRRAIYQLLEEKSICSIEFRADRSHIITVKYKQNGLKEIRS